MITRRRRASDTGAGSFRDRTRRLAYAGALAVAAVLAVLAAGYRGRLTPVRDTAPAWSADSRRLVFASERSGQADLYISQADGTDRRPIAETPDADEGAPAIAPNGRQVAFETNRDRNFEIYVMNLDGTSLRRLTHDPAQDRSPAWSPDGRRVAFSSNRHGQAGSDLYVMNVDGTKVERLTATGTIGRPAFSPDGTTLAVDAARDVHLLDVATRALRRLTFEPNNGVHANWAPDGTRLAFMSWRNGSSEIFTMSRDGSKQTRVATMATGSVVEPRWSPDGTRLAFVHGRERTGVDGPDPRGERALYILHLETGRVTRVSP